MRAGRQVDGADEIDAGGAAHGHDQIYDLSLIHISEPTRLGMISYAVFCLKKKKKKCTTSLRREYV